MVLDLLGRETSAHLDYQNTDNLGEIKHKYKPGPCRALTAEDEFFLVLCRLKVSLLNERRLISEIWSVPKCSTPNC